MKLTSSCRLVTRKSTGFTIVELAIVIAVIGILVTLTTFSYKSIMAESITRSLQSDLTGSSVALKTIYNNNGEYPSYEELINDRTIPRTNGNDIKYVVSSSNISYCLEAYRKDKSFYITSSKSTPMEGSCPDTISIHYAWTQISSPQLSNMTISSGSDKIIGYTYGFQTPGDLYLSTDMGNTWNILSTQTSRNWAGVSISTDGNKIIAMANLDSIYLSTDSGSTWTQSSSYGNHLVLTVSDDGSKAAWGNNMVNSNIYVSTDSGVSWQSKTAVGSKNWSSIVYSGDGTYLYATDYDGNLYTSTNDGDSWSTLASFSGASINYIATSYDGVDVVCAQFGKKILISHDHGQTWTTVENPEFDKIRDTFRRPAISKNGKTIIVSANDNQLYDGKGYVYISSDGGNTWTTQEYLERQQWNFTKVSEDGTTVFASNSDNQLYKGVLSDEYF